MTPGMARALSAVVLVVSIGKLGEDVFDPPESWRQERQVGEPLDGYWHSPASGGCFESENVYKFEGDQQFTTRERITFLDSVHVRQRFADGYVYVDKFRLLNLYQPRVRTSYVYRDLGSELDLVQMTLNGRTMTSPVDKQRGGSGGLRLCGSSGWSWLQLFFRRPFRPEEATFYDIS